LFLDVQWESDYARHLARTPGQVQIHALPLYVAGVPLPWFLFPVLSIVSNFMKFKTF
jgi:hypothetical protein